MRRHKEAHLINRIGWLRASVLGANDGIVSTASLIVGVAAAQSAPATILLTGIAGLVAGAMSMAAGEYVSVSSQADSESADRAAKRKSWRRFQTRNVKSLSAFTRDGASTGRWRSR